jgi:hypothetical protein
VIVLVRVVAATLAGVVVGLVLGYVPSAIVYGLVAGMTQDTTSTTGGWAEAGAIGGVVWLALAGLTVGFVQQRALPSNERGAMWIVVLGVVWPGAHIVNMLLRGRAGDVDLGSVLPALVSVSLLVGVVSLRLARRSAPT